MAAWDALAAAIKAAIDATEAAAPATPEAGQTFWADKMAEAIYNEGFSAIERLARRSFSSATEFATFTGVLDASKYGTYLLIINVFQPTTNARGLGIQFSTDNGSSWITSNYTTRLHRYRGADHAAGDLGASVGALIDDVSNSGTQRYSGTAWLRNLHAADRSYYGVSGLRVNNISNAYGANHEGAQTDNNQVNAFRLLEHNVGAHTGGQTMAVLDAVLYGLRLP